MKKKNKLVFEGAEPLALLLYICSISTVLMYVLCRSQVFVTSIIMTAVCFGIFYLFYILRKRRLFTVLVFTGLLILVNIMSSTIGNYRRSPSFAEFIFRSSDFFQWDYAILAIVMFSFIIGFTVAYFGVHLPRTNFLLLPSFVPLILAARTLGGLPVGLIIFLGVGFLAAMLGTSRPEMPMRHTYFDDKLTHKERLGAMGAFAAGAVVLLIIIPRIETSPYSNSLDNVFVTRRNNYYGTAMLTDFMKNSVPNRGANRPADDVLFSVVTNAPKNVSRWSFDIYEGEEGWTYDDQFSTGSKQWKNETYYLNSASIVDSLKSGSIDNYKEEISSLEKSILGTGEMTISVRDGSSTSVVMHPSETYEAVISGEDNTTFRNTKDEIFTRTDMQKNATYTLRYYVDIPNESLIKMFEKVNFVNFFSDPQIASVIGAKERSAYRLEYDLAHKYYDETYEYYPEIEALAKEITAGIEGDYEKALAIESWFKDAGFVYDMDFVPEKSTADYFLFKSKRGICTDFATATTLLLRAVGIPARYTEGFVLSEDIRDAYGRFNVTPAQAHAYSTAYIEGAGWIEIDGTRYANPKDNGEMLRLIMIIILALGIVLAVLGVIFRDSISEFFFGIKFKMSSKEKRIREVYIRTRSLACRISGMPQNSTTSAEVTRVISGTLGMENEASEIAECADAMMYGIGKSAVDGINELKLYENYKRIHEMKKNKGIK